MALLPVPLTSCYSAHPQASKLWVLPGVHVKARAHSSTPGVLWDGKLNDASLPYCQETAEEAVILAGMAGITDRNTHVKK